MSLDCELIKSADKSADEIVQQTNQLSEIEPKDNKNSLSKLTKTIRQSLSSAPAKKRIKLEQQLIEDSFSSTSLTPSPSPKDDQLNDNQIKENGLNENLIKETLKENHFKDSHLKEIQSKDNLIRDQQLLNKSKNLKRPETPPSTDHLNSMSTIHPALANLPQLSNPLINQNLLSSLQHQQHHNQLNSLAQLYTSAGSAAAQLLSPNSMKNLKFSIDNILQPEQIKNSELQLSKLHFQLQQHHLAHLQKQHMHFNKQLNNGQTANQSNQSKSPLNENNDSNDSANFNSSVLNSSMVEESKNNLTSIWPGWAYCRSYTDPASGKFLRIIK